MSNAQLANASFEPWWGAWAPRRERAVEALPQRADVAGGAVPREDLLADAPNAEDGFFVVPKVIE